MPSLPAGVPEWILPWMQHAFGMPVSGILRCNEEAPTNCRKQANRRKVREKRKPKREMFECA